LILGLTGSMSLNLHIFHYFVRLEFSGFRLNDTHESSPINVTWKEPTFWDTISDTIGGVESKLDAKLAAKVDSKFGKVGDVIIKEYKSKGDTFAFTELMRDDMKSHEHKGQLHICVRS
jgi:hypothetical protein